MRQLWHLWDFGTKRPKSGPSQAQVRPKSGPSQAQVRPKSGPRPGFGHVRSKPKSQNLTLARHGYKGASPGKLPVRSDTDFSNLGDFSHGYDDLGRLPLSGVAGRPCPGRRVHCDRCDRIVRPDRRPAYERPGRYIPRPRPRTDAPGDSLGITGITGPWLRGPSQRLAGRVKPAIEPASGGPALAPGLHATGRKQPGYADRQPA